jgi:hypothetical protein
MVFLTCLRVCLDITTAPGCVRLAAGRFDFEQRSLFSDRENYKTFATLKKRKFMKLKKEYLLMAIIILGLALYLINHKLDHTNYTLPELDKISAKQINKIEIIKEGETIALNKKDDSWFIGPQAFPAERAKVDRMLDVITKLSMSALVSESKNYALYDLNDPQKITVKAWTGNKLGREFDLGKTASTFQHTFMKLAGNPNVYHAKGDFRPTFDTNVADLRDKTVLSFNEDAISEIQIIRDEKTIVLKQKAIEAAPAADESKHMVQKQAEQLTSQTSIKTAWQRADGQEVNQAEIKNLLTMLLTLECEAYLEGKTRDDLKNPRLVLILKDSKEYALSLFSKATKEAENIPAVSSTNAWPFELSEHQVDNLYKNIDAFITAEPSQDS